MCNGFVWLRIGSCGNDKEVMNLWVLQIMRISQPRENQLKSALWLYIIRLVVTKSQRKEMHTMANRHNGQTFWKGSQTIKALHSAVHMSTSLTLKKRKITQTKFIWILWPFQALTGLQNFRHAIVHTSEGCYCFMHFLYSSVIKSPSNTYESVIVLEVLCWRSAENSTTKIR